MIIIGETSARPTHYRHLQCLEGIKNVFSITVYIWNAGILSNPKSAVNASSKMLGELSVDFCRDSYARTGIMNADGGILRIEERTTEKQARTCNE